MMDFTGIFDRNGNFATFSGYESIIRKFREFSEKTRREGLLSLEDDTESINNSIFRTLMQSVIDGTAPELVRQYGEEMIRSTLHSLEGILSSVKFTLINREKNDSENLIEHYIKSRDLSEHSELTRTVCRELKEAIKSGEIPGETGGRHRDILDLMKQDMPSDIREKMLGNHIDSIIYINRVYYGIILDGVLSIQAGDNPILTQYLLIAKTHILYLDYEDDY